MNIARFFAPLVVGIIGLGWSSGTAQADKAPADSGPQAGQKVAFMGDSITQFGFQNPGGYVTLVASAMEKSGRKIEVIPAGISGNTSRDMLARLKRDVLDKKPDWMTLSCGVNDVWHGDKGCTLDEYKTNIGSIVDQATAAGIKVVILTATMIQENPENELNKKLAPYNDYLHSLAAEKHFPLADLNADMLAELTKMRAEMPKTSGGLTVDGVHMNGLGNQMMATGVLKAFGVTDAQIADAQTAWNDVPNAMFVNVKCNMTVAQYLQLRQDATNKGKLVDQFLSDQMADTLQSKLKETQASPAAKP